MNSVTKGDRIVNFFVDQFFISLLFFLVVLFLDVYYFQALIYYTIMVLYYFIFESVQGQTLGKKVTGTIVVNMQNEKPSVFRILLRSLLRLNPFDFYSYAFGNEQGGHDLISKTRLIQKKKFS